MSYDQNGNMLSDGSNSFTWDARDQVSSINDIALQYDGFGRRTENLFGASFLFDGSNAVQELNGSTVAANSITGGVDEVFNRSDSSGTFTPLRDANGNVIALADSSGNIHISYSYDPFGNTSFSASTSTNPFQYTGRENELNGLYYYRARYYLPVLGRFISEDPIGFGGGVNFYQYVGDDPTNESDPIGLQAAHHRPLGPQGAGWDDFPDTFNCLPSGTFGPPNYGCIVFLRWKYRIAHNPTPHWPPPNLCPVGQRLLYTEEGPNPFNEQVDQRDLWRQCVMRFQDDCMAVEGAHTSTVTVCSAWVGVYGPQAICQCCKEPN